jgi:hypothetical protein
LRWLLWASRKAAEVCEAALSLLVLLPGCWFLQVHDELLFEVSQSHLQQVAGLVRAVMEGAGQVWRLRVALPVKLAAGPSWGQLQDFREDAAAGGSRDGTAGCEDA